MENRQGAATRTVQRSHLHPYLPGESVAVVVFSTPGADECSAAELSSYDRASFAIKPSTVTQTLRRTVLINWRIQIAISTGCPSKQSLCYCL